MRHSPKADLSRLRVALEMGMSSNDREACRSIVDIGCGRCDECALLLELFPAAVITLVEIDASNAAELQRLRSAAPDRITPIVGDARDLRTLALGPYDLVIIRHPDIQAAPPQWDQVIQSAIEQLRTGGRLILTVYSIAEAEAARRLVERMPCREIPLTGLRGSPVALAGNDRYIMLVGKF